MDELIGHDAVALGELVRKGEVSPLELVDITIQRIEKVNPQLNAVIHKMYPLARETAESWQAKLDSGQDIDAVFCGVPFLLKDLLVEYAGAPFSEGSRAVHGYISKQDSELLIRQKNCGLNVLGKTNTSEFGCLPMTASRLFGTTVNPWNPSLSPGGSSGASAAAVAAGIVPMAHGNDGGGSIRIPASCCGLFGLKPTRGRNPLGPIFGDLASGLVSEHALTRSVRDSAALLDATSGPDLGDPYYAPVKEHPFLEEVSREPGKLKIGVLTSVPEGWSLETDLHPDCLAAVKDAAQLCEQLGHFVEEANPSAIRLRNLIQIYGRVWISLIGHVIAYWERELGRKIEQNELEPVNWEDYQAGLSLSGGEYLATMEEIQRFSRKVARWHYEAGYDLLLTPTMRIPPAKLGELEAVIDDPAKGLDVALSFNALTRPQNLTGQPAMSVPLYWNTENIPIGVQFAARFGDEATLFRLAGQLEKARPWNDRLPSVHCSRVS